MEKRERDIESGLRRQVEKMGGKFMKFTSPGNDGVPDRIAILPGGRVWFVELKREGEKPTAVQKWQMEQLRKMGCNVALITGKQEAIDQRCEAIRNELKRPHHVCGACGHYDGREVVAQTAETDIDDDAA